jgi:epoxyqueuosine reductase QueG
MACVWVFESSGRYGSTDVTSEVAGNYEQLRQLALREGAALFGVADAAGVRDRFFGLSARAIEGMDRAVSVGFHLSDRVLDDLEGGPSQLYYFHYQRVNMLLDSCALKLSEWIQSRGRQGLPVPASQIVDWEKQRAHVSHKHIARAAGLGWIGRNNLLVNAEFGARLRLVSVLTDMPLPADRPAEGGCGDCEACMAACPGGCIKERPEDFDHLGCYAQIRALVKAAGISQNICGLCVKACRGRRGLPG